MRIPGVPEDYSIIAQKMDATDLTGLTIQKLRMFNSGLTLVPGDDITVSRIDDLLLTEKTETIMEVKG